MSREIKFRYIWKHKETGAFKVYIQTLDEIEDADSWQGPRPYNLISRDQFTGLRDKDDQDIYEGDIVSAHNFYFDGNFGAEHEFNGVVMYSEWATFGLSKINPRPDGCSWFEFADTSHFENPCLEVIGNIYENPELLEAA